MSITATADAQSDALKSERSRTASLHHMAAVANERGLGNFNSALQSAIESGTSTEEFSRTIFETAHKQPIVTTESLGLSEAEQKRYSISNVIDGMQSGNRNAYAFEAEVSRAAQSAYGHGDQERICIPQDILLRGYTPQNPALAARFAEAQRATVGVGVGNSGAAGMVAKEFLADMYLQSLREDSALLSGATILTGLVGDAEIPLELINPAFAWIGEDVTSPETEWGSGKAQFTFKTLSASIPMTRKALKQSALNLDALISNNIRLGVSLALERAAWSGTLSATQPGGILTTGGIGAVTTGGTLTFAKIVELRGAIAAANARTENAKFYTSSRGVTRLRSTAVNGAGSEMVGTWQNGILYVEGKPVAETNLIPQNLGVGLDRTAILFGNAASVFVGTWGGVEIAVDTATKAPSGGKVIRLFQDADVKIPQPGNWAAIADLL